ncbi:MAG: hypothetical protein WBA23_07330 [Tunicatimonas sp.]|uniref:hypothetical protein n=1 Tax=Tunicatimonas sp. TaxID=1940096 RepID=UPI003C73F985
MKKLWFIAAILIIGCSDDEDAFDQLVLIEARSFTVEAPPDWEIIEDQGYDTYVGRIVGRKHTIAFAQGFFAFSNLDNIVEDEESILLQRLEINDVPAVLHKEKSPDPTHDVLLSVYLETEEGQKNHLYIFDPHNEPLIIQIFLSHKFR